MAPHPAANKIRQWQSRERREDAIETGTEDLIKAMRREGLHVDFVTFLKVGVLAMPVALVLALASVALM